MSNILLKQLKIAREFSPKGKLPDEFHKWFEIKPTVLAKKTMKGVFAVTKIPKNMILGELKGKMLGYGKKSEEKYFEDASCIMRIDMSNKVKYINAKKFSESSWVRFVNTGPSEDMNNTEFFPHRGKAYLRSTKIINPGDELFAPYKL